MAKRHQYCRYQISLIVEVVVLFTVSIPSFPLSASSDAYETGYDHGCDDARISDPSERYYNQPEKGPSFHTEAFNRGYNDGFSACSGGGNEDNDSSSDQNDGDNGIATQNENGMYQENGYVKPKSNRPPTNPDFNPDYSCLFDVFQLKCIPGSQQECPEGFSAGDPETCFAETFINGKWEWECPEGYHSVEDDETGQCYPDSEGCPDGMIWRGKTAESHTACINE